MGNIRFRYILGFCLTALLGMGSAFAQSQVKSPTMGKQFVCNPLNSFGNWFVTYPGGGGGAFIAHTAKSNAASQCLYDTAFNFSIPSTATVTSLFVTFNGYIAVQNGGQPVVWSATLINQNGAPSGSTLNTPAEGNSSPKSFTLGGSAALWSPFLNTAEVNSSAFGVSFQASPSSNGSAFQEDVYITDPTVTVNYTNGGVEQSQTVTGRWVGTSGTDR